MPSYELSKESSIHLGTIMLQLSVLPVVSFAFWKDRSFELRDDHQMGAIVFWPLSEIDMAPFGNDGDLPCPPKPR